MAKKNKESKKDIRYPSPILLMAAAIYLGYMAYLLWKTISDGTAVGGGLIASWIGFIAFIILAIALIVLSIWFNKKNNEYLDKQIAEDQARLDEEFYNEIEKNSTNEGTGDER